MAKKNNEKMDEGEEALNALFENALDIKRVSDYTEEKAGRVAEELISMAGDNLFDMEVIIGSFDTVKGGLYEWSTINIQDPKQEGVYTVVMTNSPTVAKKLRQVKQFPVLARFVRREVRGKFKYDLE